MQISPCGCRRLRYGACGWRASRRVPTRTSAIRARCGWRAHCSVPRACRMCQSICTPVGTTRRWARRASSSPAMTAAGAAHCMPTSGCRDQGSAALKTKTTLVDLRRADFVPARSLDESISCASDADLPAVQLTNLACTMPIEDAEPIKFAVPQMDLTAPRAAQATLQAQKLPLEWVFGWMRLFSARIPQEPNVQGTVDANLVHVAQAPVSDWDGTVAL